MLDLARGLADCDERFFAGWLLARANIQIKIADKDKNKCEQQRDTMSFTNQLVVNRKNRAVFVVSGNDAVGRLQKRLEVLLLLPTAEVERKAKRNESKPSESLLVAKHSFDSAKIDEYTAYTGDKNIIHQQNNGHVIVPGLCMLAWLQKYLALAKLNWQADFLAPVYAGEQLDIYRQAGQFAAYVDNVLVFRIKIRG